MHIKSIYWKAYMNKISTSVVPSYLAWVLVFTAISICVLPISIVIGSITSTSNFAINITGKFICPADTVPKSYSYATTVENKDGKLSTAISDELHCIAYNGEILDSDATEYSSIWIVILIIFGLLITSALTILLVTPANRLVAKLINQTRK